MLGDVLEIAAAATVTVAVTLLLLALTTVLISVSGALFVVGAFLAYEAQVWAQQPIRSRRGEVTHDDSPAPRV